MSQEKAMLLMFKGVISELPKDDQDKINAIKKSIEKIISDSGQFGELAFQFIVMELAVKASED